MNTEQLIRMIEQVKDEVALQISIEIGQGDHYEEITIQSGSKSNRDNYLDEVIVVHKKHDTVFGLLCVAELTTFSVETVCGFIEMCVGEKVINFCRLFDVFTNESVEV